MHPSSAVVLQAGAVHFRLLNYLLILSGFTTVGAISLHVLEFASLHLTVPFLVAPVLLAKISLGLLLPERGRLMLIGWLFGTVAVALYDISRVPFIIAGWSDFVPRVGCWVFQSETTPDIIGYIYRYAGNGGGMGMSFLLLATIFSLKRNLIAIGIAYGLFINANLLLTLLVAPNGEALMFELTALNCFGSFIGHVVYGSVLGCLVKWYLKRTA